MNKRLSTAFLIIFSILVLALKDSASCIHAILHYIPNNTWHHHDPISRHKHSINPFEVHKYLQHKHAHEHGVHTHAHDVMDHIHPDEAKDNPTAPSEEIKNTIKIDCYFQALSNFKLPNYSSNTHVNHFSIYLAYISNRGVNPPYQPPQV